MTDKPRQSARVIELKRKLKARDGLKEYAKANAAMCAEIARLESAPTMASQDQSGHEYLLTEKVST